MNRIHPLLLLVVGVLSGECQGFAHSSLDKTKQNQCVRQLVCPLDASSKDNNLPVTLGVVLNPTSATTTTSTATKTLPKHLQNERRQLVANILLATTSGVASALLGPTVRPAVADFAPGGTLVDYNVGVTVGNPQASATRKVDNTNVLFAQDYYFKFGTAAPWIEPDSTDFPKTMPFTKSQQRYEALKKYGERVQSGLDNIARVNKVSPRSSVADPAALDIYQLRPMGLLANNLLASENTGSTNELYLARWYINEIYLLIGDLKNTESDPKAKTVYAALVDATNSYLTLMNRVILPKVGEKFVYLQK